MEDEMANRSQESSGLNRRRLLKGAAAAGVGVAAWSVPSITSLGGTPVYAAACTGGKTETVLGTRNTDNGGCGTGNTKTVRYKPPTTNQCSSSPSSLGRLTEGSVEGGPCGAEPGGDGLCFPTAGFCITPPLGLYARGVVQVRTGNCEDVGTLSRRADTGIVGPGAYVPGNPGLLKSYWAKLPEVFQSELASGNTFARYSIETARDDACF
jgi:hypothetical protein